MVKINSNILDWNGKDLARIPEGKIPCLITYHHQSSQVRKSLEEAGFTVTEVRPQRNFFTFLLDPVFLVETGGEEKFENGNLEKSSEEIQKELALAALITIKNTDLVPAIDCYLEYLSRKEGVLNKIINKLTDRIEAKKSVIDVEDPGIGEIKERIIQAENKKLAIEQKRTQVITERAKFINDLMALREKLANNDYSTENLELKIENLHAEKARHVLYMKTIYEEIKYTEKEKALSYN